jgi:hypothetical protein
MRDWLSDLVRLKKEALLADMYQRALGALHTGDRQTAQDLLTKVVALDAGYGDATRYLHMAVTGVDVAGLQAELAGEVEARLQQEQELEQLRAESEAGREEPWPSDVVAETEAGVMDGQLPRVTGVPDSARTGRDGSTVLDQVGTFLDHGRQCWRTLARWLQPYPEAVVGLVKRRGGDWLVSTLVWLPLFIPALAIGTQTLSCTDYVPSPRIYLWISLGLGLAWILTGWLGRTEGRVAIDLAAVIAWGLAIIVACSVVGGLALDVVTGKVQGLLGSVVVVVTFVAAGSAASGVASAVADDMASAVAAAVATAMTFVVALVVVFVVAVGLVCGVASIVVAGVVCGVLGGVVCSVVGGVARSTSTALGTSLLAHVFLIWFSFLDGWRVFQ